MDLSYSSTCYVMPSPTKSRVVGRQSVSTLIAVVRVVLQYFCRAVSRLILMYLRTTLCVSIILVLLVHSAPGVEFCLSGGLGWKS